MKKLLLMMAAVVMLLACKNNKMKSIDLTNLDTTANPTADFYQYAAGGWMAKNPIPDDKSRYGSFDKLAEDNQKQVKELITNLGKHTHKEGTNAQKIGRLYNIGMDTVRLNKEGSKPIEDVLLGLSLVSDMNDFWDAFYAMQADGSSLFFGIFAEADAANSKNCIAWLAQSGLGMGDRDYYLEQDDHTKSLRASYLKMLENLLVLSGFENDEAMTIAAKELNFETELAKIMMSRLEMRDPVKTYNKMTVAELKTLCPAVDWTKYFNTIGLNINDLSVCNIDYLKNLSVLLNKTDVETLQNYLICDVILGASASLSQNFKDAAFEYYGKALSGKQVEEDRWKSVVNTVSGVLGEAIGEEYVKIYFPKEAKERMLNLVENIRTTLGERIQKLDWMSEVTKAKALDKLAAITVKIGYPDTWRDYSALNFETSDSYFTCLKKAAKFEQNYQFAKIGKNVNPKEWLMTPQTVNAYYNPTTNEICFPAGILQPPFFFAEGDDACNYGAIGVVIAHEITHGFDDQGRLYDKDGNLKDWWTAEDAAKFEAKSQVLVDWFNQIEVAPGVHADGKLSLGENIADFGGITISYNAFQKTQQYTKTKTIDGFTPAQRFFLAYATVWTGNIREQEILRRTKEDVHSLGKWRVNGQMPHFQAFDDAFGVKEGDPMWLAPELRANIW
ncbi:MAG: M13 family metallopeptidase [Bacteroidales bacterium]|jgi:putative endopeptidase|nr:M13 family metallopeptidase [Bacteroidales bacterium]